MRGESNIRKNRISMQRGTIVHRHRHHQGRERKTANRTSRPGKRRRTQANAAMGQVTGRPTVTHAAMFRLSRKKRNIAPRNERAPAGSLPPPFVEPHVRRHLEDRRGCLQRSRDHADQRKGRRKTRKSQHRADAHRGRAVLPTAAERALRQTRGGHAPDLSGEDPAVASRKLDQRRPEISGRHKGEAKS